MIRDIVKRSCSIFGTVIFFDPSVRSKETGSIIPLNADGTYHSSTHLSIHRRTKEFEKKRQLQSSVLDEQTYSELFEDLEAFQ
jgi:hypothetical protein